MVLHLGIGFELLARIPKNNSMVIQTMVFELWLFQYHGCFGIEPNSIPTPSISTSKRTPSLNEGRTDEVCELIYWWFGQ